MDIAIVLTRYCVCLKMHGFYARIAGARSKTLTHEIDKDSWYSIGTPESHT